MDKKFEIEISIVKIKNTMINFLKKKDLVGETFVGSGLTQIPMTYEIIEQDEGGITIEDEMGDQSDHSFIELDIEMLQQLL